jgi:uncharacterized membrane protein YraQ (UPF0718 family)
MTALFADVLFTLVCLLLIAVIVAMIYKYRAKIKKFASDPEYGKEWRPDRKTILRRDIEDAEAEIEYLENKEKKED